MDMEMGRRYPFDAQWKASVDRDGPQWLVYCEAVFLVKRYIRTRLRDGREAAVEEFEKTCADYGERNHGPERVEGIRERFRLIWANERQELKAKVLAEDGASLLHRPAAAA